MTENPSVLLDFVRDGRDGPGWPAIGSDSYQDVVVRAELNTSCAAGRRSARPGTASNAAVEGISRSKYRRPRDRRRVANHVPSPE